MSVQQYKQQTAAVAVHLLLYFHSVRNSCVAVLQSSVRGENNNLTDLIYNSDGSYKEAAFSQLQEFRVVETTKIQCSVSSLVTSCDVLWGTLTESLRR